MHADHGTQADDAMELRAMAQRYTGPSAARIEGLIPHEVDFERGWFRTSTAICHGGEEPFGLAFRQRPDGNGIEVRCHTGGCTRAHVITAIEGLIGLPIWTAYEPVQPPAAIARVKRWVTPRLPFWAGAALMLALPLLFGHGIEAALWNVAAFGVAVALLWGLPGRIGRAFRA